MADWEDAPSATTTSSPTSSVAWEDAPSAPKKSFNEKYIQPVTDVVNRGLVGGLAGGFVDLANLPFQGIDYLSKKAGYPTHISSDKPIGGSEWFGEKMQDLGAVSSTRRPLAEAAVGFAPLAIGGGVGAVKAIGKVGSQLAETLGITRPELNIKPSTFRELGAEIGTNLETKINKQFVDRSKEAQTLYDTAIKLAREKQVEGVPFAQSDQGRALINALEQLKTYSADGKTFQMGEDQVKGIDRLINAVKGTTTGGEISPVGSGIVSSKMTKKSPTQTTEKDIKAIVEELRYLREPNAKGKPAEAYAGLSDKYKLDLAKQLEQSLYGWNPEYEVADQAYKAASQKLNVFKTELMSRIMRGEKFDFKQMAADPETFAKEFFKSQDTVQQLKQVTGDSKAVDNLAGQYAATVLENKTPDEIKRFALDPNNEGWLAETGLKDKLIEYANQSTSAATKRNILKWLGFGVTAGATGGALSKYDLNRMLGGF